MENYSQDTIQFRIMQYADIRKNVGTQVRTARASAFDSARPKIKIHIYFLTDL